VTCWLWEWWKERKIQIELAKAWNVKRELIARLRGKL